MERKKKFLIILCILGCIHLLVTGVSASLDVQGSENYYTTNDTIRAGTYPLQYVTSISTFVDDDTAISNISYSMGVDNMEHIITIDESQYVTKNSTDITWVFPNSLVVNHNENHLVQIRTDLYSPQYVPISLSRTMNRTQFSAEGYQKVFFDIAFENITYAYQNKRCDSVELGIHANENSDLNATILLDTVSTDAPGTFYNNKSHSFTFVFDKSEMALNHAYNFSMVIHVVPNGTVPVIYKPYFGVTLFNYTSRTGTPGSSTSMPSDMLPPHLTYATASQNVSLTWNYFLEYGRGARLSETKKNVSSLENGSQIGVFRPSTRQFIFNTAPVTRTSFGLSTDIPITGDWNGDNVTDGGVFRPSTGQFIFNTAPVTRTTFGLSTDIPITGDWNGDGRTDIGVFRPSTRQFIFNTAPITRTTFGLSTDIPITGDWDGDGITDIGVFRPSTRQFIFNTAPITRTTFGLSTDIPITGDWNGDGITDIGIFRPSARQFISNTAPVTRTTFGLSTDKPVTGKWN